MEFRNEKHKIAFTTALKTIKTKDKALVSALYLLTADNALWRNAKRQINGNHIPLRRIRPRNITEDGYTLLCSAKDMLYGTAYLTANDLADRELISPKLYKLICNAMAIRRYGIAAKQETGEKR